MAAEKTNLSLPTFTDDDVEKSIENNYQLILINFLKSSVINNPHSVRKKLIFNLFSKNEIIFRLGWH
jgi:hypothetical protein